MSARAPREPYRVPRPGSVANNRGSRRNGSMLRYNRNATYRNSRNQLTPAQMDKLSRLVKTTDSLYHRIITIVKEKTCRRKPEELNLKLYSEILKDPKQTDEAKRDVMVQLIALKQIFKGERVVDKNTVSLFKTNDRALTIIAIVIACVGFVMPLGAFGDMVAHGSPEFIASAEDTAVRQYETLYPSMTEDEIRTKFSSQINKIGVQARLISGAQARPIAAALSAMGTGIIGFIPSLVSGFVTAFVAPIPVTLILSASKNAARKYNLKQTLEEIEKIINDPENPEGLAEEVEEELKITAIQPPPPEEIEHITAAEAAAPLQPMNEFMNRGVNESGLPRTVQRLNNFTRNSNVKIAWGNANDESRIKFSGVNNTFTHEAIAKENAESLVEARKPFSIKSGLFTTAKGRQAQANANNTRANAEWFSRNPRVSHMPEATRSANGKKSAMKKGGRKTRKVRR